MYHVDAYCCNANIKVLSARLSYGWGLNPVRILMGFLHFTTSLFPKDGSYLLPEKAVKRKRIGLMEGDRVTVELEVDA